VLLNTKIKSGPLFSIIIPCYNYEETIERAIASVLAQSGDDFDLLVIDDGSKDQSVEVIRSMQDQRGGFEFISKGNEGLASTRNRGIDETTGEYLIFLDADDEMSCDALINYRRFIVEGVAIGMLAGGHLSRDGQGNEKLHEVAVIPLDPRKRLRAYLLDKKLAFSNGAVAISRNVFDAYRYPEKFRSSEDISMFAFILANYLIIPVDKPLAIIHKHTGSLRHNVEHAISSGLSIVDEVFNRERIPVELQGLKKDFLAQRCLSLFRTLFIAGDYSNARHYYHQAVLTKVRVIFQMAYFIKYVRSFSR